MMFVFLSWLLPYVKIRLIVNEHNAKKILNIVNEDYLKSIVSDTVFLSLSKTNI